MSPSVIKKKKKSVNRVSLISNVSKLHKHNFNLRQTIFIFLFYFLFLLLLLLFLCSDIYYIHFQSGLFFFCLCQSITSCCSGIYKYQLKYPNNQKSPS